MVASESAAFWRWQKICVHAPGADHRFSVQLTSEGRSGAKVSLPYVKFAGSGGANEGSTSDGQALPSGGFDADWHCAGVSERAAVWVGFEVVALHQHLAGDVIERQDDAVDREAGHRQQPKRGLEMVQLAERIAVCRTCVDTAVVDQRGAQMVRCVDRGVACRGCSAGLGAAVPATAARLDAFVEERSPIRCHPTGCREYGP